LTVTGSRSEDVLCTAPATFNVAVHEHGVPRVCASFLFVGFSLSDPNFNLIRDDARLAMGDNMPASYLAQERPDPVVRGYLDSLGVRTIALESWNAMPLLLNAINPA
jgi:SIR2-like domain